ncbi:MFS transporter [Brevibacillus sp. TJ4]|uniref:MFS transporter n=1 Tax=Brevibacillus sp. TJ4 TaxID=3234853 RepID=UPI003BA1CE12
MTNKPEMTMSLWRNQSFARLWCGTILSALADGAFMILLSWYIVDVTGSEAMLGTTLVCFAVPRVLFMLVGGVAADRWSRKWILFSSMAVRGLILLFFSAVMLTDTGGWLAYTTYATAFLFGTVDAFFWPARSSILPSLIPREQLPAATSMMEISQQFSMVCGPLAAALLMRTQSYPLMFAALALSFFAGAVSLFALRLRTAPESAQASPAKTQQPTAFLQDILSGVRYSFSVPILCIFLGTTLMINMVFSGPINMGLPLLVKDLDWKGTDYSTLGMMMGIGMIAGGAIAGFFKAFRGKFMLLPFLLCLAGSATSSLYFMEHMMFGMVAMTVLGLMISMTNVPIITYIQSIVPGHLLGRVMSLISLMSIGMGPVSYSLCSLLLVNKWITPAFLMLAGGIAMSLFSLSLYLFREFRRAEQHPDWTGKTSSEAKQYTPLSS